MRAIATLHPSEIPPSEGRFAVQRFAVLILILCLMLLGCAAEGPSDSAMSADTSGQTAGAPADRQAFYGDLHVHTAYSFDASAQDTRNTPYDAYRFARGGRLARCRQRGAKAQPSSSSDAPGSPAASASSSPATIQGACGSGGGAACSRVAV